MTINGYHDVPKNNEQSLLKALANQPLSVAIEASGRDFQFYSGVMKPILKFSYIYIHINSPEIHIFCLTLGEMNQGLDM